MKLKDINRTATFAWDNSTSSAPLIATGAAAGAVDATFSNDSQLEIWQPEFSNANNARLGVDGSSALGSITVNSRFNRIAWSVPTTHHIRGILATGMEDGEFSLYDPSKILSGSNAEEARIYKNNKHTQEVKGVDFNPVQKNLVLTGAVKGELFIHDLNKPDIEPYLPGLSSKDGAISSLQWNPNVSRVFAASSSAGYTSVWDVKAAKEVVSLQYGGGAAKSMNSAGGVAGTQMGSRRGMSDVVWHPENATRLITASEDDDSPIIMLWDLRNTRAPEKILSGHNLGVLSLSWCKQDADLLLSCGKDKRTLCWNPQSGEIVGELPLSGDWSFQTSWCPRNPDLLATASFDGHIGIHSLQTTSLPDQSTQKLSETATADDVFGALSNEQPIESTANVVSLRQAPKWLRRPVSATFGFGGFLVSTSNLPGASGKHQSGVVHLRIITTEDSVLKRAKALEEIRGEKEKLAEFCAQRASAGDASWKALQTLFKAHAREELVKLLGFSKEDVAEKVKEAVQKFPNAFKTAERNQETPIIKAQDAEESKTPTAEQPESGAMPDVLESLKSEGESITATQDKLQENDNEVQPVKTPSQSLFDDDNSADFFTSIASAPTANYPSVPRNPALNSIASHKFEISESAAATAGSTNSVRDEVVEKDNNFHIYPAGESDVDKLITQALIVGDFKSAVDLCLASERFADALLLAVRGGPELLQTTQTAYFTLQTTVRPFLRVFQSIVTEDLLDIVQNADLSEWKVIFVVLCTFAKESEFANLTEQLGQRLQFKWRLLSGSDSPEAKEGAMTARRDATLCYLAARKLEKVIGIWIDEMHEEENSVESTKYTARAQALQSFIEKVSIFLCATGYVDEELSTPSTTLTAQSGARQYKLSGLYNRYLEYADVLATQDSVEIAESFVKRVPADYVGDGIEKVRERVLGAMEDPKTSNSSGQARAGPSTSRGQTHQPQRYASAQNTSYGQHASVYQQASVTTPYQPAVIPQANNPYAPPPTQSSNQPQPQSRQAQQSLGNNPYAPVASTFQATGYASNGYNPANSQPQGYGAPLTSQQSYGQQTVIPPPPRAGQSNGPISSTSPTPTSIIPGSQRRDIPGWNDAPALAPKRPTSATKVVSNPTAIVSPFPNSPSPYAVPNVGASAPTGPGGMVLPPSAIPPPPKNARPPSAAPKLQPLPTVQQQQQYTQQQTQQRQQYAQQHGQQQQQYGTPSPQAYPNAHAGPPPSSIRPSPPGVRAAPASGTFVGGPPPHMFAGGPPPSTLMGGPPPQRILSPLGPGRAASGTKDIQESK
ncbi:hypothetical protein L204_106081 [Cryptococcus depauperatus]|nr:protein transporter SEC31 [Cryptococcus depauperatus CBS 7855]